MAYDEGLAARVDEQLGMRRDVSTKRMFGGIAWMLNGNMFVGIVKDDLMFASLGRMAPSFGSRR